MNCKMQLEYTNIKGLFVFEPTIFEDHRGYFYESMNFQKFVDLGMDPEVKFVQMNHSLSRPKVLRGMHFQKPPFAQDKLVRVIKGKVLDVVVDMRSNSETYKHWTAVELSAENKKVFFVPKGFAHGFIVLGDEEAEFEYLVTNPYSKESEGGFAWNDPEINIEWPITDPILSEKDSKLPLFKDLGQIF